MACIHEHVSATIMESLKTTVFCPIAKSFAQIPWKFLDKVFTSIRVERKIQTRRLIKQRETMPQSAQLPVKESKIGSETGMLTHFQPMSHFYNRWKHQKPPVFYVFRGYYWNIG